MGENGTYRSSAARKSIAIATGVLAAGILAILLPVVLSLRQWSWPEALYDLGMGVFTATAIAAILGVFLQQIDRREAEARESLKVEQARLEQDRRDYEEQNKELRKSLELEWNDLEQRLENIGKEMNHTLVTTKIDLLGNQIFELQMALDQLREKVDPGSVYPESKEIANRVAIELERQVKAGEHDLPAIMQLIRIGPEDGDARQVQE